MSRVDGRLKLTSCLIDEQTGKQIAEVFVIADTYAEARYLLALATKNARQTLEL